MVFDVNQTEFVSKYQKEVWSHGVRVVPLDISLVKITDPETRDGCTQVYQCIMEILSDMFSNPQDYEGIKSVFYLEVFFEWHPYGNRCIPVKIQKQHGMYEHILDRLSRFGFTLEGETLTNTRYPLFMQYWRLLSSSSGTGQGNIILCDFRYLIKPYKRTIDDLMRPLPDDYKQLWRELFEYAAAKGAKLESRKDHMFRWEYKKRFVLVLMNTPPYVEVPYRMNNGGGNIAENFTIFLDLAKRQPDADNLVTYIQDNLCLCDGCPGRVEGQRFGKERCGLWFDINGKRRLASMCHSAISRVKHGPRREPYTARDVTMLKRMIDLRFLQLDGEKDGI